MQNAISLPIPYSAQKNSLQESRKFPALPTGICRETRRDPRNFGMVATEIREISLLAGNSPPNDYVITVTVC